LHRLCIIKQQRHMRLGKKGHRTGSSSTATLLESPMHKHHGFLRCPGFSSKCGVVCFPSINNRRERSQSGLTSAGTTWKVDTISNPPPDSPSTRKSNPQARKPAIMAVEVNTRTTYPYTAVSLIVVTFPDGHKVAGTGTMVGPNDLLTAAHVVYSPDHGGWASALSLYPGADFNGTTGRIEDAPYVVENFRWQLDGWPAQAFSDDSNATFRYEESQYDVAVIGLSKAIGMQTGWFGLARGYNTAQWASVLGYASGTTGLMSGKAWVTRETSTSLYAASAGPGTDLLGSGSSGGPLYVVDSNGLPSIIGVKSAGTASTNIWADIDLLHDRLLAAMSRNDALIDGAYRCKNIPDADATAGRLFSLALAADTFKSGNAGGHLAYTATLADGSALPSWLKFDAATKAFSGTPASTDSTGMSVRVTARAADGSSASDEFRISVGSAGIDYTGTPGSDRIAAQTGNDMIDCVFRTNVTARFGGA
jgi:V8-like Glu-specific endopeptidase